MRLALAQINPLIGDFAGNTAKICSHIDRARQMRCDLVIFPELSLIGYPPRDLLDKSGFVSNSRRYWERIREQSGGIGVIVGAVCENTAGYGKPFHNSALFYADGELLACAHKVLLPSYDVFDEDRYFEPGKAATSVEFRGRRIGLTICEDIWNVKDYLPHPLYRGNPVDELAGVPVQLLVNIAASPYHIKKGVWIDDLLKAQATRLKIPIVYVNQVGGNDELVFQGRSTVWSPGGAMLASGADFREDLVVCDSDGGSGELHAEDLDESEEAIEALVTGLRDYALKCGFREIVVGLSGGVDSALTAALAVKALGSQAVLGVAMPGPYNAPESLEDAMELAARLNIAFQVVPIDDLFDAALNRLAPVFGDLPHDVTEENLQARLRGLVLMAFSNKYGRLLLSTGNKSEIAVGYCTLYGDMNGGLAVLGDVPKTLVYRLASRLNQDHNWIPARILTRPPSAELRPDQRDQDTLPPYEILDPILHGYVERRMSVDQLIGEGWDAALVKWIVERVDRNEYKRWQSPPVLRITRKAFGTGRRLPIAQGYRDW